MSDPIYIFAGGGTGGHLYPGLAVAEELLRIQPGARVVFACSNRRIDRRILDPLAFAIVPQPVLPLPRGVRGWPTFLRAWRASKRLAADLIGDLKPAGVLGLGGFAAGPVVRRSADAGVRAGLLNPDAVPGKANRFLARHVEAIFTQFESTAECFSPRGRRNVHCVGCPVRSGLLTGDRREAVRKFNLRPGLKTLLVLGGSLGAASVNAAVAELAGDLSALAETWQVLHITGPGARGADAEPPERSNAVRLDYCDRMDLAYAAADLALCRGGAGTIAELSATATPAVIMPYPHHADRQQYLNASALAGAGAATIVEDRIDPAVNAAGLRRELIGILRDPSRLEAMKHAARGFAGPNAARDVAEWLIGK